MLSSNIAFSDPAVSSNLLYPPFRLVLLLPTMSSSPCPPHRVLPAMSSPLCPPRRRVLSALTCLGEPHLPEPAEPALASSSERHQEQLVGGAGPQTGQLVTLGTSVQQRHTMDDTLGRGGCREGVRGSLGGVGRVGGCLGGVGGSLGGRGGLCVR